MTEDIALTYLIKAERDLSAIGLLEASDKRLDDVVTFHAQQAVEKSFKAFLVRNDIKIRYHHGLMELLIQCESLDPSFSVFRSPVIEKLDAIGVSVRYNDITLDPTPDEASAFSELAGQIYRHVSGKIK